jgi:hypothetical protein
MENHTSRSLRSAGLLTSLYSAFSNPFWSAWDTGCDHEAHFAPTPRSGMLRVPRADRDNHFSAGSRLDSVLTGLYSAFANPVLQASVYRALEGR